MARAVVATFPTLSEAQIACSALKAAGFDAAVLDEHVGTVLAVDLVGGFRLVTPEAELDDAEALLEQIAREAP